MGFLLFVWNKYKLFFLSFGFRYYRHNALVTATFVEINHTVNQRIKRVVFANTNVLARVMLGTTLANNDVAGDALLAAPDFNA